MPLNELASQQRRLRALHRILTRVRTQAYLGTPGKEIGAVLDDTEYLTTLIFDEATEQSEAEFRLYLERIGTRYAGFDGLLAAYDGLGEPASRK